MSVAAGAVAAGIATAASGLGQTILNNVVNWKIAQENRNIQRETNSQNEALMREAWARDDTARQRMVVDLENAGLSKWLAAGASPMSSSPISLTAPQNDYKADFKGDFLDKALSAYQNVEYIAQTQAQTKNLQDQNKLLAEQIKEAASRAALAAHDVKVYENRPDVATNDSGTMKAIGELINQLTNKDSSVGRVVSSLGIAGKTQEVREAGLQNWIDEIFGPGAFNEIIQDELGMSAEEYQRRRNAKEASKEAHLDATAARQEQKQSRHK